jgi:hypothetical protein
MNDLASDYLKRHALPHKRPKSLLDDRQMLAGIIIPRLGTLRVTAAEATSRPETIRPTEEESERCRSCKEGKGRLLKAARFPFDKKMVWIHA